jgi:hypothetical protein
MVMITALQMLDAMLDAYKRGMACSDPMTISPHYIIGFAHALWLSDQISDAEWLSVRNQFSAVPVVL